MTICVKLGPDVKPVDLGGLGTWNLNFNRYMQLNQVGLVKENQAFDAIIVSIFSTGVLSLGLFFALKHFNCFNVPKDLDSDSG